MKPSIARISTQGKSLAKPSICAGLIEAGTEYAVYVDDTVETTDWVEPPWIITFVPGAWWYSWMVRHQPPEWFWRGFEWVVTWGIALILYLTAYGLVRGCLAAMN